MKKKYHNISDYHTDPQDPELPFFERYISAKELMARWGINFIQLRQYPLIAYIQTKPYDYSVHNPYLLDHPNRGRGSSGIEKCQPYTKEDFEHVMYDFYALVRYEYHHPEIIKNPNVCPQLEDDLHPTKKRERDRLLLKEASTEESKNDRKVRTRQLPPYLSTDPDKKLDEFLGWIKLDVFKFYNSLKTVLGRYENNTNEAPDYIKFAKEAFEEQLPYQWLEFKDLSNIFIPSFNLETKYRVVPGKIAQNLVARMDQNLAGIEPRYENLYKRLNKLS